MQYPMSADDFDFNIDFDTAFSNIPIDIPPSILTDGHNHHDAMSMHHEPSHLSAAPSPGFFQTSGTAHRVEPNGDSATAGGSEKAPLFNAYESSMISQFFEKMNADPEFIFSPKLDESLLSMDHHGGVTSPGPFGMDPYSKQTSSRLYQYREEPHKHETPPATAWDIPTPEGIHPLLNSPTPFGAAHSSSINQAFQPPPHQQQQQQQQQQPTVSVAPEISAQHDSYHTAYAARDAPYSIPPAARPSPVSLRKLPIKFGTDPSFQKSGFQPSFSLSSSIRSLGMPGDESEVKQEPNADNRGAGGFQQQGKAMDQAYHKDGQAPQPVVQAKDYYNDNHQIYNNNNNHHQPSEYGAQPQQPAIEKKPAKSSGRTGAGREGTGTMGRPRRENLSEDQKRMNHISSEKRRRDLIKTQFKEMCSLVPRLNGTSIGDGTTNGGVKPSPEAAAAAAAAACNQSKSVVLQIVYEYIELMVERNKLLREFLLSQNVVGVDGIRNATVPSSKGEEQ